MSRARDNLEEQLKHANQQASAFYMFVVQDVREICDEWDQLQSERESK